MSFEFNVSGKGGSNIPALKSDVYAAVLVRLVDLGTHHDTFQNKPRTAKKVVLSWEIIGETIEMEIDGKKTVLPRVLSKTYTASVHEKATLRKELESWRGQPFTKEEADKFNIGVLLGKSCQLNVAINEGGKNTIKAIIPAGKDPVTQKRMAYTPKQPLTGYIIGKGPIPSDLPKWIVDEIYASDEGKKLPPRTAETQAAAESGPTEEVKEVRTEDIPF